MNFTLIDSSAWIEYFADSKYADLFSDAIEKTEDLVVPSIVIHEVFKKLLRGKGETTAINATTQMKRGRIIELSDDLAVLSAKIAKEMKLSTADSIIYATAYITGATIWTMDKDFKNIEGVKFFERDN